MTELEIDIVLDILSNNFRREILRLLTVKERYAFELSKILNISQRAVTKHLKHLETANLVFSEKRKSSKGPAREYFALDKAVILSFTLAPNLFRASIRALNEDSSKGTQITPTLQLGVPKESNIYDIIKEGLTLLPEIREGLDLLQIRQNRLLRAYQGLQTHISEFFNKQNFTSKEVQFILWLIENEGEATSKEMEISLGKMNELTEVISKLEKRKIINTKIIKEGNETLMKFDLISKE